jgi:hypothetical protein
MILMNSFTLSKHGSEAYQIIHYKIGEMWRHDIIEVSDAIMLSLSKVGLHPINDDLDLSWSTDGSIADFNLGTFHSINTNDWRSEWLS